MKKLILFLSFLLFNSLILSFAAEKPNPVLDSDGEEIRAGVEYYMVNTFRPFGGGVIYGPNTYNKTCPLAVVQTPFPFVNNGLPVTFTPVNPEEGVVRLSTDLNIKFTAPGIACENVCIACSLFNVWKVDFDRERGQRFILSNGVEGNPGCGTIANWFKIEQLDSTAYKLVFCPKVCSPVEVICKDVGRFVDRDVRLRRLVLGDVPTRVVFIKAESIKNQNILKSATSA